MIADQTSDGTQCSMLLAKTNLALRLKIENTAPHSYDLNMNSFRLMDDNGQPIDSFSEGLFASASGGAPAPEIELDPSFSLEETICARVNPTDDFSKAYLVVGQGDEERVRVPLVETGPADLGVHAVAPFNQSIKYKGADINFTEAILTNGVWDNLSSGQAVTGMLWLLLPTEVKNNSDTHLFIEDGEVILEVGDQVLEPELATKETYQAAPYGLDAGLTAQGSLLFAVPKDAKQATLHFKSSSSDEDLKLEIALPSR